VGAEGRPGGTPDFTRDLKGDSVMNRKLASIWIVVCTLLLSWVAPAVGAVKLPAVIGDHMVIQRGLPVKVWGTAEAGEKVTVSLAGKTQAAAADKDGKWAVTLPPMDAGGPMDMTVAGTNRLTVKDILVGEVWVCSGQSNMAWTVRGAANPDEETAAAKYPKIRMFTVARKTADTPQPDCGGAWSICSPKTAGNFSAVGYFFGRSVHKALNVPVGLINTSWGGTRAEPWTSRAGMKAMPMFAGALKDWDARVAGFDPNKVEEEFTKAQEQYKARLAKWAKDVAAAKAAGKTPPRKPRRPRRRGNVAGSPQRPANLFNGMIAPLIPLGIRGAIWYQGESNAGQGYKYRTLFPGMITDWRKNWGQGDFPFLFVQLANFRARAAQPGDSAWAELREAQAMTLKLPATGMAVIIDIGAAKNIHPKNKQDVGGRLALAARAIAYGEKIVYSGPMYKSMSAKGNKVTLTFDHVGGGLKAAGGGKLVGFAVAGADKKFVWADAAIAGETVVVSSATVAKPVAVRYAWGDNPACNLTNAEGLPGSPFRTDDWPGVTVPAELKAKMMGK